MISSRLQFAATLLVASLFTTRGVIAAEPWLDVGSGLQVNPPSGYAVHPMTTKMLWGWVLGDVLMLAIAGAIIGAIYKPTAIVTTAP